MSSSAGLSHAASSRDQYRTSALCRVLSRFSRSWRIAQKMIEYTATYRVGQKPGPLFLRPITLEILNRSLPSLAQIKVTSLHSEHRARIYLNQLWKIVAPSSEWQWAFYNYKFWIGYHFLTSFQPTSLHCYFTYFLIINVRMTTFTHQLLARKKHRPQKSDNASANIPAEVRESYG